MSIPDSAEYWWPVNKKLTNEQIFGKRKVKPHDCKPRGGKPGTPYRRFCRICGKSFSRESMLTTGRGGKS